MQSTLASFGALAAERGYELPRHEFAEGTPHVRNAHRPHVHPDRRSARVNSLELLNQCFYQANISEADLRDGSFTVTCRFVDFNTGRTILYPLDLRVPEGSRYNSFCFITLFENYCDQTEAVPAYPHGKAEGSKINHDMRVFARRLAIFLRFCPNGFFSEFLNTSMRFITLRLSEALEYFEYCGNILRS